MVSADRARLGFAVDAALAPELLARLPGSRIVEDRAAPEGLVLVEVSAGGLELPAGGQGPSEGYSIGAFVAPAGIPSRVRLDANQAITREPEKGAPAILVRTGGGFTVLAGGLDALQQALDRGMRPVVVAEEGRQLVEAVATRERLQRIAHEVESIQAELAPREGRQQRRARERRARRGRR